MQGSGHYVGNVLNVLNRAASWWGEGDEKIYVDGESFPSQWGTGTEDYYGYAWCSNERFSTPYIGQPRGGSHQNFGYHSLYRFHVFDPIPFRENLQFDFEIGHWGDPIDVTYDAVMFWYAREGATSNISASSPESNRIPALEIASPTDVAAGPYVCGG
jgi:hypothetical protein